MQFKTNINQIHFQLSEKFNNVKIEDGESKEFGKFFTIIVEGKLPITIPFKNLETTGQFTWYYPSNPNDKSSYLVERSSDVGSFSDLVIDIIENGRFSGDYKNTNK